MNSEQRWTLTVDKEKAIVLVEPNIERITSHMGRVMKRLQEMIRYKELEILYSTAPTEMLQQMHEVMVRELDKRMGT